VLTDEEDADPGEAGTLFGAAEVTGVDVFAAIPANQATSA
jgi:hypothetical protein